MHKFVSLLVNFHKTVYHKELDKLNNNRNKAKIRAHSTIRTIRVLILGH